MRVKTRWLALPALLLPLGVASAQVSADCAARMRGFVPKGYRLTTCSGADLFIGILVEPAKQVERMPMTFELTVMTLDGPLFASTLESARQHVEFYAGTPGGLLSCEPAGDKAFKGGAVKYVRNTLRSEVVGEPPFRYYSFKAVFALGNRIVTAEGSALTRKSLDAWLDLAYEKTARL